MLTRRLAMGAALALAAPLPVRGEEASPPEPFSPDGRYLPFWQAINDGVAGPLGGIKDQYAATLGLEAIALAQTGQSKSLNVGLPATPLRAREAIGRIVEASRGRRVVFLNEAHVCSRHRAFLLRLLTALRPEGFTHFAAETFVNSTDPDAPNIADLKPGGPLDPDMGFYLHDPVFAEAVRGAVGLGYRLVRYENRTDQVAPAGAAPLEQIAVREQAEADNFAAFLAAEPQARVLVHVGYGHLRETPDERGVEAFAARLKRGTGIDPLTVTQANIGSFGPRGPDARLTREVLQRFHPTAPIIVEAADGSSLAAAGPAADLAVFHPSLPDVRGRPGWWAAMAGRRWLRVPTPAVVGPLLVQAVHEADPDRCIPADHVMLEKGGGAVWLRLRPGRYRLRLETLAGFTPLGEVTV